MITTAGQFSFRADGTPPDRAKAVVNLCRTDLLKAAVQVVRRGGENNLHSHPHRDEIFYVLRGHVRFYTEGDEVLADLGPDDGVLIPRGFPYWFEVTGDQPLELLQVAAADSATEAEGTFGGRVNHAPRVDGRAEERVAG